VNHLSLLGQDLAGWTLSRAYWLELSHELMGFFPAVLANEPRGDDLFVCLDTDLLAEVGKLLTPRRCKVIEITVIVNEAECVAFDLCRIQKKFDEMPEDETSITVLTRQRFDELVVACGDDECPFKWAPGLVGSDMSSEEFFETLRASLERVRDEGAA